MSRLKRCSKHTLLQLIWILFLTAAAWAQYNGYFGILQYRHEGQVKVRQDTTGSGQHFNISSVATDTAGEVSAKDDGASYNVTNAQDGDQDDVTNAQDSDKARARKIIPNYKTTKASRRLRHDHDKVRILYNRVPKCGSSTLGSLLNVLKERNGFAWNTYQRKSLFSDEFVKPEDEDLKKALKKFIARSEKKYIMSAHLLFVDFTRYDFKNPIYINLVRDPLERLVSMFYYLKGGTNKAPAHRKNAWWLSKSSSYDACVAADDPFCTSPHTANGQGYFNMIPYFCGREPYCFTDCEEALQKAKANVEQYYTIVGVLEEFPAFLRALEVLFPSMLHNISTVYEEKGAQLSTLFNTRKKITPKDITIKVMKEKLKREYDFYYFVKERFYSQVRLLERENGVTILNDEKPD